MKNGCLYWLIIGWWFDPCYRLIKFIFSLSAIIGVYFLLAALLIFILIIALVLIVGSATFLITSLFIICLLYFFIKTFYKGVNFIIRDVFLNRLQQNEESSNLTTSSDDKTTVNFVATSNLEKNTHKISDDEALAYARMCNGYLEHQDEMTQYDDAL